MFNFIESHMHETPQEDRLLPKKLQPVKNY